MDERRKHPRTEIDEPAYVSSGGSVMACVVRNISPEGAAIDVENPAFVIRPSTSARWPGSSRTG